MSNINKWRDIINILTETENISNVTNFPYYRQKDKR